MVIVALVDEVALTIIVAEKTFRTVGCRVILER